MLSLLGTFREQEYDECVDKETEHESFKYWIGIEAVVILATMIANVMYVLVRSCKQ